MPPDGNQEEGRGNGRDGRGGAVLSFENDIFISYAHIDNETFLEQDKGWVSKLHRALELRIAQLHGKAPKIWRDPKLQGNDAFADRLDGEVPKTALLVSVLSPRYLSSDWCRRELETFIAASERSGGLHVGDKSRVFKVVKTPIPIEKQPPIMQKMLGYEFFVTDPETGRPSELSPDDPENQRHYWSRLDDLAYDICQMLDLVEEAGASVSSVESEKGGATEEVECVYLAATSADLREEHDILRRDLMLRGVRVLPEQPLPMVADELIATAREHLARCRLSIHLVGRAYGVVPEGATESGAALENELAHQRFDEDRSFARLVWLPPGLEAGDDRQRALIERLRTDPRLNQSADLLECPLEGLKTEIRWRLEKPPEDDRQSASPSSVSPGEGDLKHIYLVADPSDEEAALDVEEALFDLGFEVIASSFEGDEAQIRLDHQESLRDCDAVLIYYGAVSEPWLRRKLREVRKSAAFGRQQPLLGTAVYVGPPETARKARLKTREAMVLPGEGGLDPAQLAPFLEQLDQPQGGVGR